MIDFSKIPNFWEYENWDNYMANLWQHLIAFRPFDIHSSVVEIAPGAASKILKALAKLNFEGKYFIIEPHIDTSEKIYKKAKELLPKAEISLIQKNFKEVELNCNIDYLFANHSFDDFITAYANRNKETLDIVFQDISDKKQVVVELLSEIWENLSRNPETLSKVKQEIEIDFLNFVSSIKPKIMIMSQYPSAHYERCNLHIINKEALDLFQSLSFDGYKTVEELKIQELLDKNENYKLGWIVDMLHSKGWKIYERI